MYICNIYVYIHIYIYIYICPKKLLPRQASELTAGNMGRRCKPPDEVQGARFQENLEINVS